MTALMRRLDTSAPGFDAEFADLLARQSEPDPTVVETVRSIVRDVRLRGDAALLDCTRRFDRRPAVELADLELPPSVLADALASIEPRLRDALEQAATRIERFHALQCVESWQTEDADGALLGTRITPLDRVGVYVPGGRAAYPSSVLMNVIPARVAGVPEVVMVVPAPDGRLEPVVLAAAAIAGVHRVYTIGGAQAIAALAYGTGMVPRVDKIVGPGNIWVATAKSLVFGAVGIDMIAGPSEITIVCDGGTSAEWIAMDLFSQAEHDEEAQAILLTPDEVFADAVAAAVARLLPTMERGAIIRAALAARGAIIHVRDLEEAALLVNRIAPEHLELSVDRPEALLPLIRHAGAIFMGRWSAEALGDYCAGPNHVLPTAGTARFSSPLGVYDFQKRSSIIGSTPRSTPLLAGVASTLARAEGLTAHARSAEMRLDGLP